jgi:antitoxin HigA-1
MKSLRDSRRRPAHPGAILREDVLPALRMSQTELAERLGASRVTVNTLLQEKRDLSVELAARIAKLLGHTPQSWLRMQEALDLWRLAQNPAALDDVKPLPRDRVAA